MSRFHLVQTPNGPGLEDRFDQTQPPLTIDFANSKLTHRRLRGGKKELLLRAVGAKRGLVVSDWTAGLGTDSLLLASAGCQVNMYERSRLLWLLLADALKRQTRTQTSTVAADLESVLDRMTLHYGDARDFSTRGVDVIYLDPMFAQRKKTALVNGPMQHLQKFVGPDLDAENMLDAARSMQVSRVVIKRPTSAPKTDATFTLEAKANRFDVYEQPAADYS